MEAMPRSAATRSLVLAILGAFSLGGASCSDGTRPEYFAQRYIIEVDSVSVALSIAAGDTLVARFWGYVGPNSCHAFEGFEADPQPHRVDLTLWTKYFRRIGAGCVEESVYLDGVAYRQGPLAAGEFTLVVHQPDGSTLDVVVPVAE